MKINPSINRFLYFFLTLNFLPLLFLPSCPHWWIIYCYFSYIFQENEVTDYIFCIVPWFKTLWKEFIFNCGTCYYDIKKKMTTEMDSEGASTPNTLNSSKENDLSLLASDTSNYTRRWKKAFLQHHRSHTQAFWCGLFMIPFRNASHTSPVTTGKRRLFFLVVSSELLALKYFLPLCFFLIPISWLPILLPVSLHCF